MRHQTCQSRLIANSLELGPTQENWQTSRLTLIVYETRLYLPARDGKFRPHEGISFGRQLAWSKKLIKTFFSDQATCKSVAESAHLAVAIIHVVLNHLRSSE
jgi:hypothetical protein